MMWKIILPFFAALFAVGWGSLVPGGPLDIDPNDAEFQRAKNFAVYHYNLLSDDIYYYRDTEVFRAQSQVVEGINYIMTLKLEKTSCQKNMPSKDCPIINDPAAAHSFTCEFTVWVRVWLNDIRLWRISCW